MTHEIAKHDARNSSCVMSVRTAPQLGEMAWEMAKEIFSFQGSARETVFPENETEFGHTTAVRSVRRSSLFVRRSRTFQDNELFLTPAAVLRVRCTRRIGI